MIQTLKLLLPALIPSWNFFDVIAASPRIEYAQAASADATALDWRAFRPRPARLSLAAMLARLVWNARWNEALYVVSCAERLINTPTAHSQAEIFRRIAADLADQPTGRGGWLSFRILLVSEHDGAITRELAYLAEPVRLDAIPVR
ncbi:MAG: hypothetical protein ACYDD1_21650 [Caulobacteraceae bacterium]